MQGIRLSPDDIVKTFGISRRLAVRIGALLSKKIEVTATLVEIAGPGSPVEKLLLHPNMLSEAATLDTGAANALAVETGADAEGAFVVIRSDNHRLLALEEELLAQAGADAAPIEKLPTLIRPEKGLAPHELLDRQEISHLFNSEEIARIKLDALAGPSAEARISALRKLTYAPLSPQEKGGIYLRVLLDPAAGVRSEAIKGLESLGFNRNTADAIQAAFDEHARKHNAALARIGELLSTLQPAEVRIVLAVLIEMFRETPPAGPRDALLQVLGRAVPIIADHAEVIPELTRICVQHLINEPLRVGPALRDLLLTLAQTAGKVSAGAERAVLDKLWEELPTVTARVPRALLLAMLMEAEEDDSRRSALCELGVAELVREDQDELTRQKLGHNMVALGTSAAQAILKHFASAPGPERALLVSFLDILCSEQSLSGEQRNEVARHLVKALKGANRRLRMEILRTRVFHQPDLDPALRQSLARDLLPLLAPTEQPDVADRAAMLLECLGEAAAGELFGMLRRAPAVPQADIAARSLGAILADEDAANNKILRKMSQPVIRFLSRHISHPAHPLGGYAVALARIATSPIASAQDARDAFDLISGIFGKASYHAEAVEAIARLVTCDAVTARQRLKAAHQLGALVERPDDANEALLREIETDKGKLFELAGRIDFASATLPAAIQGLCNLALAKKTSSVLHDHIVDQLLRVWKGVAAWKLIWGPHSAEELAHAVGRIGADPHTTPATRLRVIKALATGMERLSVVRALGHVFAQPCETPTAAKLVVNTALDLLEKWIEPDITPEELGLVLTAAAHAAAQPEISSRGAHARNLRTRTAQLLFDALAAGHPWSVEPLEMMRDCAAVGKRLRNDIAARLKNALAVTKR